MGGSELGHVAQAYHFQHALLSFPLVEVRNAPCVVRKEMASYHPYTDLRYCRVETLVADETKVIVA